jgi:HPt (histidine-containing phosphotransfer) domain-containing protein
MAQSSKTAGNSQQENPRTPSELLTDLLQALEGDREALGALIGSFLASYRGHLQHISAAIGSANATSLERSAHHFKGSLGIFCQTEALVLVQRLMEMGERNTLDQAPQALERLELEVAALAATLRAFIGR